jgi:glycosyltransferase involved in cell wall biosynthesis
MISVIMSVFNNESTLKSSIESILNQTFKDFEFLIMDDQSTDNSYNILKDFESKDNRIKVFRNLKNEGLTKSLNILIENSERDLIARQDGDDISHISRLQKQIKYLTEENYDFCVSKATIIQSRKVIPKFSSFFPEKKIIKIKNPFIHGTLLIKKQTLLENGCYDENFYYSQDYKLFSDLLKKGVRFKYLKTPLYYLNMVGNISSINRNEQKYYANCVRKNESPNLKI